MDNLIFFGRYYITALTFLAGQAHPSYYKNLDPCHKPTWQRAEHREQKSFYPWPDVLTRFSRLERQAIHYDGQTWEGRIESMSYSLEESRQNGGISFDLSFTVYNHKFNDPMEAILVERLKNLNSSEGVR